MASKAVMDAVEQRLAANWTATAIIGANQQGDAPNDGSSFVIVQYPVATTERPSVTTRKYREEGVIRLVLNSQRGIGTVDAATMADSLAALFRDQKFGGVECHVPDSFTDDDASENGNFFVTAISVPYSFNFTG